MRRFFLLFTILSLAASLHGQKTRAGQELPFPRKGVDYALAIHVYEVRWSGSCPDSYCRLTYKTIIAGKKREFVCGGFNGVNTGRPLRLGDTHGRALPKFSGDELGDRYEILTPGGRVMACFLSGIAE